MPKTKKENKLECKADGKDKAISCNDTDCKKYWPADAIDLH